MLDLSKVVMNEFHMNILKISMVTTQDYFAPTPIWCMKLQVEMFMKVLVRIKKCLILEIIRLSQNIYDDDSNKLVLGKP